MMVNVISDQQTNSNQLEPQLKTSLKSWLAIETPFWEWGLIVQEQIVRPALHPLVLQLETHYFFGRTTGALKATGNRGLQPAMDHILEYESHPVPDLGGVTESSGASARNAMDVDDDEDAEALKSLGVVASGAVEAKVSSRVIW